MHLRMQDVGTAHGVVALLNLFKPRIVKRFEAGAEAGLVAAVHPNRLEAIEVNRPYQIASLD
jgi:hypothetical protein